MAKPKELRQLMKYWRATPEDLKLLEKLKAGFDGVLRESDLVRMGLRALERERAEVRATD
jgi:hypothetical protein